MVAGKTELPSELSGLLQSEDQKTMFMVLILAHLQYLEVLAA